MRTVHPSIVIGSYVWDQDRVPRDEFQIRIDALNHAMDANGWKAVLIYGDAAEHSLLGYFSNFTPRLRFEVTAVVAPVAEFFTTVGTEVPTLVSVT